MPVWKLAPFTLGEEPHRLSADRRAQLRRAASDAGIAITGLHWLLLTPPGLSITAADPAVRQTTLEILKRLVDLGADLGRQGAGSRISQATPGEGG